ncbi:hypothetical protein O181_042639, partial [Austropuccinia psidii MF-1]|nr:hypothetical protein [Austropuccinia psidii MF-1]
GEAESLRALGKAAPGLVPKLYLNAFLQGQAVMISEYFNLMPISPKLDRELGRRLASMHDPNAAESRSPNGLYGFHVPTYCGETEQDNRWEKNWITFFRDRRLKSLLDLIGDSEIEKLGKTLCDRVVPFLLADFEPKPVPVIIHGDLWSGNIAVNQNTMEPVLFDPSSYYGHNEVELGIMKMFGGRSDQFFDEYHRLLPKSQPHYEERIRLYELYHHLNHTLMFGGGYRLGAVRIMNELIQFVDNQARP